MREHAYNYKIMIKLRQTTKDTQRQDQAM